MQMDAGAMVAMDPRNGLPGHWSLKPEDTAALVFWTKDPSPLVAYKDRLAPYKVEVHVTWTQWYEAERGAPGFDHMAEALRAAVHTFGANNVVWRFSPIPLLASEDVVKRFGAICEVAADVNLGRVFLSFLQPNDLVCETRTEDERFALLEQLAVVGNSFGLDTLLCNEDRLLQQRPSKWAQSGVCANPVNYQQARKGVPASEGCGCALMVDPFTQNESCTLGCTYCYAGNMETAPKKRNTTRLPVIR